MVLLKNKLPRCEDCLPNKKRIELYFSDYIKNYLRAHMVLRTVPNQSNSAINDIELVVTGAYFDIHEEGASTVPTIPYGEYRLIKQ